MRLAVFDESAFPFPCRPELNKYPFGAEAVHVPRMLLAFQRHYCGSYGCSVTLRVRWKKSSISRYRCKASSGS